MPREATGSVDWVSPNPKKGEAQGHYKVRITLADGARPWIHLDPGPKSPQAEARAREKAAAWTERARIEGRAAADFGIKPRGVPLIAAQPDAAGDRAMQAWFDHWLRSRQKKGQTSTRENDAHWRVHIEPVLGAKHIKAWTRDDLRALSRALDEKIERYGSDEPVVRKTGVSWKTAQNIWGTATKMCADAAESKLDELRVREDNPAIGVEGPERGARKSKQYLYPSEFLRFVSCGEVPLQWRRIVVLMVYLYPRPGELRELRWEDVDLEHGIIHVHQATDRVTQKAKATKTERARRFNIEPALLPLLRAMHDARESERVIDLPSDRDLARGFRLWLMRAKVERAELHKSTPTRKAITVYDLRATGITWLAIRGDEPLRIMQRAGHASFSTTQGYIREAENLRDGFGRVFPALPSTLIGGDPSALQSSSESSSGPPRGANYPISQRRGRDSNPRLGFIPAPA
jgi:integrase